MPFTIPIARSDASVSNCSSSPFQNATRTGSLIHACLSVSNALLCFLV
jgi:hypothetical protein